MLFAHDSHNVLIDMSVIKINFASICSNHMTECIGVLDFPVTHLLLQRIFYKILKGKSKYSFLSCCIKASQLYMHQEKGNGVMGIVTELTFKGDNKKQSQSLIGIRSFGFVTERRWVYRWKKFPSSTKTSICRSLDQN